MIYQYTTSHNFPPYIYMNIDIYSGWLYGTEEYIGTYLNHVEDISTWLACILRYLRIKLGPTLQLFNEGVWQCISISSISSYKTTLVMLSKSSLLTILTAPHAISCFVSNRTQVKTITTQNITLEKVKTKIERNIQNNEPDEI